VFVELNEKQQTYLKYDHANLESHNTQYLLNGDLVRDNFNFYNDMKLPHLIFLEIKESKPAFIIPDDGFIGLLSKNKRYSSTQENFLDQLME
jgi:hypothetical protein